MADDTRPGIKDAICAMSVKAGLAFFLITVAAVMTMTWMIAVLLFNATVDAGMAALLASFVTMFIKMAADASGYQYTSSAGSEKKDEVTAATNLKLAEKVGPNPPPAVPIPPWWSRLSDPEKNAITAAAVADPRVAAFVTASQVGAATLDDLAYLVTKGLLTQDRPALIAAT